MAQTTETSLTVAAAGDAMVTKRVSTIDDEGIKRLRDVLTTADAAVVNLEGPLHDYEPAPVSRKRTHFRSPPWAADELTWLGFDLFSATNNHIGDYGQHGMLNTIDELDRRDIAYTGIGEHRGAARAPTYVETPGGRVALLAATTTFVPGTEAAYQRQDVRGRPGISTVRLRPRYAVTDEHLDALRELHDALAIDELMADRGGYVEHPEGDDVVPFLDVGAEAAGRTVTFERGDENAIYYEPHQADVDEITEQIRVANRNADRVLFSLHSHEGGDGTYNDRTVPPFLESFARGCVDEGVDAFFCHGPHRMRGLEVYADAPIFYSLGNFILQYDAVSFFPAEGYESRGLDPNASPRTIHEEIGAITAEDYKRQAIVPVCVYEDGALADVRVHPVVLGPDRDASTQGMARLAEGDVATEVIDRLSTLSEPYDTEVRSVDGIGIVDL